MAETLIAPSLLAADFGHLARELGAIEEAGADWVHLDVMDGRFVPNLTIGPPVIGALRKHSKLFFDVHLMIVEPERSIADYAAAGAQCITVHAEACTHLHRTLAAIRELGVKAGVSLNPATPLSAVTEVLELCDLVLLMTVNPGFGGQTFIDTVMPKLRSLRDLCTDRRLAPLLEVDGGITPTTAPIAVSAGANVLVAGSAVFRAPDYADAIRGLRASAATVR